MFDTSTPSVWPLIGTSSSSNTSSGRTSGTVVVDVVDVVVVVVEVVVDVVVVVVEVVVVEVVVDVVLVVGPSPTDEVPHAVSTARNPSATRRRTDIPPRLQPTTGQWWQVSRL